MGRRNPDSARQKAIAAGFKPDSIKIQMQRHGWSCDEAIAQAVASKEKREIIAQINAAAIAAGLDPRLVRTRMRSMDFSCEEAVAMGPPIPSNQQTERRERARQLKFDEHFSWLVTEAEKIGVSYMNVCDRWHKGWTAERIITTPLNPPHPCDPKSVSSKAQAAGFARSCIDYRMDRFNCSAEEAIAMGHDRLAHSVRKNPESLPSRCEAAGVPYFTVWRLMYGKDGPNYHHAKHLTFDQAVAHCRELQMKPVPFIERCRIAGKSKTTVYKRLNAGWSEHDAFNAPLIPRAERAHRNFRAQK